MSDSTSLLTTNRKALTINLDGTRYGTIAEIGAGQEVARVFFQAGNASGSIAKTMSAYDMTFSDAIYGKAPRYVSRERLQTMLHHEYALLKERLSDKRGERTAFFVFANTVAAKSPKVADGHGWLGIRYQRQPMEEPSEIFIHVRMWDKKNVLQQEALGIVGTNLIYGAFYLADDPEKFITSLVDNVGTDRIEVDMLKFSGPSFRHVDNRLLSLYLVKHGLTNAVLFAPGGEMQLPFEAFHEKAVLVERGNFRPVTNVNVDMLNAASAQFLQEPSTQGKPVLALMELTMNHKTANDTLDVADFLARVDLIGQLGLPVMVSNYAEYFRLVGYFRRYTKEMIGLALGISALLEVFNEKHYEHLDGGLLESMGRMFKHNVRLYAYPMRPDTLARLSSPGKGSAPQAALPLGALITARNVLVAPHLRHLYQHLFDNRNIECITGFDEALLSVDTREILERVRTGDDSWEKLVPAKVVTAIKERRLLGYTAAS
jgi:hypothetical protein